MTGPEDRGRDEEFDIGEATSWSERQELERMYTVKERREERMRRRRRRQLWAVLALVLGYLLAYVLTR